jgi:hypothetical protein
MRILRIANSKIEWVTFYRLADTSLNPKWMVQVLSRHACKQMCPAQLPPPSAVRPNRNAPCNGG